LQRPICMAYLNGKLQNLSYSELQNEKCIKKGHLWCKFTISIAVPNVSTWRALAVKTSANALKLKQRSYCLKRNPKDQTLSLWATDKKTCIKTAVAYKSSWGVDWYHWEPMTPIPSVASWCNTSYSQYRLKEWKRPICIRYHKGKTQYVNTTALKKKFCVKKGYAWCFPSQSSANTWTSQVPKLSTWRALAVKTNKWMAKSFTQQSWCLGRNPRTQKLWLWDVNKTKCNTNADLYKSSWGVNWYHWEPVVPAPNKTTWCNTSYVQNRLLLWKRPVCVRYYRGKMRYVGYNHLQRRTCIKNKFVWCQPKLASGNTWATSVPAVSKWRALAIQNYTYMDLKFKQKSWCLGRDPRNGRFWLWGVSKKSCFRYAVAYNRTWGMEWFHWESMTAGVDKTAWCNTTFAQTRLKLWQRPLCVRYVGGQMHYVPYGPLQGKTCATKGYAWCTPKHANLTWAASIPSTKTWCKSAQNYSGYITIKLKEQPWCLQRFPRTGKFALTTASLKACSAKAAAYKSNWGLDAYTWCPMTSVPDKATWCNSSEAQSKLTSWKRPICVSYSSGKVRYADLDYLQRTKCEKQGYAWCQPALNKTKTSGWKAAAEKSNTYWVSKFKARSWCLGKNPVNQKFWLWFVSRSTCMRYAVLYKYNWGVDWFKWVSGPTSHRRRWSFRRRRRWGKVTRRRSTSSSWWSFHRRRSLSSWVKKSYNSVSGTTASSRRRHLHRRREGRRRRWGNSRRRQ